MHDKTNPLAGMWNSVTSCLRETQATWNDSKRREFEIRYMRQIESSVQQYRSALVEFHETLDRILQSIPE